jgi:hypothetical protein
MTRVLAIVLSATLFALVLAQDTSARRGGGIHAAGVRAGSFRGASVAAYRARPLVRGYRTTAWAGWPWWFGTGVAASVAGPLVYGWTSAPATATKAPVQPARSPGTCGENFYWKDGRCVDARLK